jgi:hypothetical protein
MHRYVPDLAAAYCALASMDGHRFRCANVPFQVGPLLNFEDVPRPQPNLAALRSL